MSSNALDEAGVIREGESYSIGEFRRRTGLKDSAIRKAESQGLRTILAHRRKFVIGRDWLAYLEKQATNQN